MGTANPIDRFGNIIDLYGDRAIKPGLSFLSDRPGRAMPCGEKTADSPHCRIENGLLPG